MENITAEQIDGALAKAFLDVNKTTVQDFINNYSKYKPALEESIECLKNNSHADTLFLSFAALKTAQDNFVNILRQSLKELLHG